jgi:type I restriction enzyme R subunit
MVIKMELEDIHYYNPRAETEVWQNRLPHWQQHEALYFVPFHLADSLPQPLLSRWKREECAWLEHHPKPWTEKVTREYHSRFSAAKERWLDEGHGRCILRNSNSRLIVDEALRYFEGTRCHQIAFVVMPNHVHTLFILHREQTLHELLQSWKSFSSKKVNALNESHGAFWQRDYFDRLVRDGQHLDNCIRYIRRNPAHANLRDSEYTSYESEFARSVM